MQIGEFAYTCSAVTIVTSIATISTTDDNDDDDDTLKTVFRMSQTFLTLRKVCQKWHRDWAYCFTLVGPCAAILFDYNGQLRHISVVVGRYNRIGVLFPYQPI